MTMLDGNPTELLSHTGHLDVLEDFEYPCPEIGARFKRCVTA
jgi:hypothetical protein